MLIRLCPIGFVGYLLIISLYAFVFQLKIGLSLQ